MNVIFEVNTKERNVLIDEIIALEQVTNATLLSHDGEVRA